MSFDNPTQSPFSAAPLSGPQLVQPPRKKSGLNWLLSLLLIGIGVMFLGGVVCIAGVWYVATHLDRWVVGLGREAIVAVIQDSQLPEDEKGEVIVQVDRVVSAYKAGQLKPQDLERVFNDLQEAPALKALTLYGIEEEYLRHSNLPDQEIESARRTFQRALRAVYEGKISQEQFFGLLPGESGQPITLASTSANEDAADDELRECLVKLKVVADSAGIPDEPFMLDVSDEITKLVDRALAGK